jgi:hypothetical protein
MMGSLIFSALGCLLVGLTIARDGWLAGLQVYLCIGMLRYIITNQSFLSAIVDMMRDRFRNNWHKYPRAHMPSVRACHLMVMGYIMALWWNIRERS